MQGGELKLNRWNSIYAEFVYHIVERNLNVSEKDELVVPLQANNWALHVGFNFGL